MELSISRVSAAKAVNCWPGNAGLVQLEIVAHDGTIRIDMYFGDPVKALAFFFGNGGEKDHINRDCPGYMSEHDYREVEGKIQAYLGARRVMG